LDRTPAAAKVFWVSIRPDNSGSRSRNTPPKTSPLRDGCHVGGTHPRPIRASPPILEARHGHNIGLPALALGSACVPDRGQQGAQGFDPMPEISQGRGTISSDIALTSNASEYIRGSAYVGRLLDFTCPFPRRHPQLSRPICPVRTCQSSAQPFARTIWSPRRGQHHGHGTATKAIGDNPQGNVTSAPQLARSGTQGEAYGRSRMKVESAAAERGAASAPMRIHALCQPK
jgi:hypothetical protein